MAHKNPEPGPSLDAEQLFALAPQLRELLKGVRQIELEQFSMEIGDLELFIPTSGIAPASRDMAAAPAPAMPRPTSLIRESYEKRVYDFPGKIREVRLGATKAEGGSRSRSLTIGGATAPAYFDPARPPLHAPVISLDVFDMPVTLPKVLRENVAEVMNDPAEWAKMNVKKFGADVVTIHLMSTDPLFRNAPASAAVKTVEDVLQAVDVPIIIGGCGDPKKDAEVFSAIAQMAEGERLLINSVTLDMAEARTLEKVATSARDHGHVLLAFTGLDLNNAKELNRRLYEYIPPEQIVMDLTTVALGYGLEYSFTIHERARYAALMGDNELAHPTISAATNAWAAREAWMKMVPEYGSRQLRGPVWETINALTLLLAGVDLFLMMHPAAVLTMRDVIPRLTKAGTAHPEQIADWVGVRI
ncbi:MAG: CO dehydrogenase/acetyl-CoA synthase subunit delta [Methanoregula sp.]|nr:CO dehydrogenase/acetyl-CoA synthase subunit delta [Methanoregula sp.]